jgi:cation/acetate symporter
MGVLLVESGDRAGQERASIDGRVSFGASALALGAGLVILLDRVGAPARLVVLLGPVFALVGVAVIGFLLRSMRVSRFFAGGRAVPASYASLAMAALTVGLFLPFAQALPHGTSLRTLAMGFAAGSAAAFLWIGPMLRNSGAYSLADLLGARFANALFRLGVVAIVAGVCLLVCFAGLESGARALDVSLGMGRGPALFAFACVVACVTVFGGLSGVIWSATAAAGVFFFGFGALVLLIFISGTSPLPIPLIGDRLLWSQAAAHIAQWSGVRLGGHFSDGVFLTLLLGLAFFPPFLAGSLTCRDGRAARRAGGAALAWQSVACFLVISTSALTASAIAAGLVDKTFAQLPSWAYAAGTSGDLMICGQNVLSPAAAKDACANWAGFSGTLQSSDFAVSGRYLLTGLASVAGFGPAFTGLIWAAVALAAVVLTAASLQALATAIGHDVVYRLRDSGALTSRRLAVSRTILILSLAGCVTVLRLTPIDPKTMIAGAIAAVAALLAPFSVLALMGRVRSIDATLSLCCGLVCATIMMAGGGADDFNHLAVVALMVGVVIVLTGIVLSFIGARANGKDAAMARAILRGRQEILSPDRGA